MGYFGLAYYVENRNRLKALAVDGGDGPVLPSTQTVENGTYQPLSRPIFIYVKEASLARLEVKDFVEFYLQHGAELSKEVGYVDLPAKAYELARSNLNKKKLGTAFGGVPEVGVHVEELLTREAKL
jgi:phosphate transport system substrate-binding protein